MNSVLSLLSL